MPDMIELIFDHKPQAGDIMATKGEFVHPRETVEIHLSTGKVISAPRGSSLETFFKVFPEQEREMIVGAIVNGELRELTYAVDMDGRVTPIQMDSADGARIYRRSLTFLLEAVFEDLFPELQLTVDHSVTSGGFYCEISGRPPLTQAELNQIKDLMRILVQSNVKFERQQIPLEEAIAYFQEQGNAEKVRLLSYRQKGFLVLYQLENHRDYHHGYMVPSTGYLKWFDLTLMGDGFITPLSAPGFAQEYSNPCQPIQNCSRHSSNMGVGWNGWASRVWVR